MDVRPQKGQLRDYFFEGLDTGKDVYKRQEQEPRQLFFQRWIGGGEK